MQSGAVDTHCHLFLLDDDPTEAVEKARSDHAEKSAEAERYRAALERLG